MWNVIAFLFKSDDKLLLLRVMCILLVKEDELLPFLQLRVMCGRIVANGEMFPLLRVYNCYMERCVLLSSLLRNISTKNENSVIIYSPHVSLMSSEGVFIKTILGNLFNIMKENEEWDCQASKCHKKYKKRNWSIQLLHCIPSRDGHLS